MHSAANFSGTLNQINFSIEDNLFLGPVDLQKVFFNKLEVNVSGKLVANMEIVLLS